MKIDIEECAALRETEVLIRCRKADERIASIVSSLQMHDLRVAGKSDGKMASVPAGAILYIECVDSRTFAYTQDAVLELSLRLHELEDRLEGASFVRIAFAVAMAFFLAAGTIFKGESHASGVMMGWGLLVACIVSSGLQLVFFTPALIKRMSYPVRATLFGLCFFPVLAGIAALFSWFPMEYPAAWISFAVAYLVILGILSLVFTCVCKRQIKELNDNLAAYKQQHRQ